MTDQIQRPRGNPNWVKGGASPNPGGRRRTPITDALIAIDQEEGAFEKIARMLILIATSPHARAADRVRAAELVLSRIEGAPTSTVNMTLSAITSGGLPPDWDRLSSSEKAAWLDQLPVKALGDGK